MPLPYDWYGSEAGGEKHPSDKNQTEFFCRAIVGAGQ